MPGVYDDERPFDYPGSANAPTDELYDCAGCKDSFPEEEMTSVLVAPGTYLEPDEYDDLCPACMDEREMIGWP